MMVFFIDVIVMEVEWVLVGSNFEVGYYDVVIFLFYLFDIDNVFVSVFEILEFFVFYDIYGKLEFIIFII